MPEQVKINLHQFQKLGLTTQLSIEIAIHLVVTDIQRGFKELGQLLDDLYKCVQRDKQEGIE